METVAVFSTSAISLSRLVIGKENIDKFIAEHHPSLGEIKKFTSVEEAEQAWDDIWDQIVTSNRDRR